jgi:Zn-dependent protease
LRAPVIFFSLTIHEFMHAWTAWKCGDDTALRQGRVTLNPLAHLDPMGTVMLFVGPIGWAKPVPVDPTNFQYDTRRRDEILVSGAGIAANFVLAVACALALRFFREDIYTIPEIGGILGPMVFYGCFINFGLAVFNFLPLFPLDGSHIMKNLLPLNAAIRFHEWRRYGMYALGILIVGNFLLRRATGFSILGFPVYLLMSLFTGTRLW